MAAPVCSLQQTGPGPTCYTEFIREIPRKGNLIALAVSAASRAARAQSSVTLYGRIDVSVGSEKKLNAASTAKVFAGGIRHDF